MSAVQHFNDRPAPRDFRQNGGHELFWRLVPLQAEFHLRGYAGEVFGVVGGLVEGTQHDRCRAHRG